MFIQEICSLFISNQSRFNMLFWVPRNMGGFVAIKQHSIGVSYLDFLDFFLSLYKTCAILITCSVTYMQWCGQCVLTALCPSRVSEAWLYKLSDWRCGVSHAHGGDSQVCSLEAQPAELFFPALRAGTRKERSTWCHLGQDILSQLFWKNNILLFSHKSACSFPLSDPGSN